MIGDSWQLRKHSLLGHWPVHSVEPPGPRHTCENGKRGGGRERWGWATKSRNRKDGELAKNQQGKKCCTCWRMEAERHRQTDGWREGWRDEEHENKRSVIADERVAWQCRNKWWGGGEGRKVWGGEAAITMLHSCSGPCELHGKWRRAGPETGPPGQPGRLGEKGLSLVPAQHSHRPGGEPLRPRAGSADDTKQLLAVTERRGGEKQRNEALREYFQLINTQMFSISFQILDSLKSFPDVFIGVWAARVKCLCTHHAVSVCVCVLMVLGWACRGQKSPRVCVSAGPAEIWAAVLARGYPVWSPARAEDGLA